MKQHDGFTLVELIVVVVVTSILAITILPRFASKSDFDRTGFRDQLVSGMQYARKVAVASRRHVCVTFSAAGSGSVGFSVDPRLPENVVLPNCTVPLTTPGGTSAALAPPGNATLTGSSFSFDPLGQASAATTFTLTGVAAFKVEQSGYVH